MTTGSLRNAAFNSGEKLCCAISWYTYLYLPKFNIYLQHAFYECSFSSQCCCLSIAFCAAHRHAEEFASASKISWKCLYSNDPSFFDRTCPQCKICRFCNKMNRYVACFEVCERVKIVQNLVKKTYHIPWIIRSLYSKMYILNY